MMSVWTSLCRPQRRKKKKTVMGGWELLSIFISNIVRFSRRVRWAGHLAHLGDKQCIQGFGGETSW